MLQDLTLISWHERTSRGIGIEYVKQLIASPLNIVIATCRNPENATSLKALQADAKGTLHIAQIDVSDENSIRDSVKNLGGILEETGLDYLVNNAAEVSLSFRHLVCEIATRMGLIEFVNRRKETIPRLTSP